jgi:glycerophosphoryl diester phosphodiesterase
MLVTIIILAAVAAAVILVYFYLTRALPLKNWLADYKFAHRGLHGGEIPENSLRAFDAAAAAGYGIELDVHLSRDGLPVVLHDDNLKRMTGIDRRIDDLTWEEIAPLRLAGTSQGIPLLADVLKTVAGRVPVLVEIKSRGQAGALEEKTYELLKEYKGLFAVQSFSPFSLGWFRKNAPNVLRGQLSSRFDRLDPSEPPLPGYQVFVLKNLLANFSAKPNFISYDIDSLPIGVVARQRRRGITTLAWTVRSEEQKAKAAKYSDTIIFERIRP